MRRFRNIIVATDFSPASAPAFRRAVDLAVESPAKLWIAHVLAPAPMAYGRSPVPRIYREMDVAIRDAAEKKLSGLTRSATKKGARAHALLLRGPAHEAIRRAARDHDADLIVVGTHGRTGLSRALMGSVAARVLGAAPCAVLSVKRSGGRAAPRRLLFATDFSVASRPAWKEALGVARAHGAAIRILHVVAPLAEGQVARWAYAEAEAEARADARKRLERLRRSARSAGVRADAILLRGVAHEEITRAARSMRDAWVVVGTHGRTGFSGALLGSVAARVVTTAPCPVLTVRGAGRT